MVEMGMGEQQRIHGNHLRQAQIAGAGTGINQSVLIQQQAHGAQIAADAAVTTEYFYAHFIPFRGA